MNRRCLIACLAAAAAFPGLAQAQALSLAPGSVMLLRHATAPGSGDPPGFRLGACATQRNLSEQGRDQARAIGARLRAAGALPGLVATSQWCRCRDTATLLDLGPVQDWPELNSFFAGQGDGPAQTAATLARLAQLPADMTALLVTHQVNITAVTGIVPRSGEIVIATRGAQGLVVQTRLPPG